MKTQGEIHTKIQEWFRNRHDHWLEFKQHIRNGDTRTPDEVDLVTTGTFGVLSGTYAVLSIPVRKKRHVVHPTTCGSTVSPRC